MKKIIYFSIIILLSGLAYAETIEIGADLGVSKCFVGKEPQLCLEQIVLTAPIQINLQEYPGSIDPKIWTGTWIKQIKEEEVLFEASIQIWKYVYSNLQSPYYFITLTVDSHVGRSSKPADQTSVSFSTNSLDDITTLHIKGNTVYLDKDNLTLTPHFVFGKVLPLEPPIPGK